MSAITLGQQGVAAVDASNWDEALPKLTKALSMSGTKPPLWLLARSKALVAKGDFAAALADAELAFNVAADRSNRDLMQEAQYRRAVAFYRMREYANADCCCVWAMNALEGKKMSEGEEQALRADEHGDYDVTSEEVKKLLVPEQKPKAESGKGILNLVQGKDGGAMTQKAGWNRAAMFRTTCVREMEKLEKGAQGRKVTTKKNPRKKEFVAGETAEKARRAEEAAKVAQKITTTTPAAPQVAAAQQKPKEVRLDIYQTDQKQTITVFAKGVDKEKFKLAWKSDREVTLEPVPGAPGEVLTLKLSGDASKDESTVRVATTKIELVVKKASPGKWARPEMLASPASDAEEGVKPASEPLPALPQTTTPAAAAAEQPKEEHPPAYPTSSKSGPKNWDKIASTTDTGEDDDKTGYDANDWFRELYKNANPDTQRAMMKSFTESNGTALSTSWDDVRDRTVETKPPEGVEAKKWD